MHWDTCYLYPHFPISSFGQHEICLSTHCASALLLISWRMPRIQCKIPHIIISLLIFQRKETRQISNNDAQENDVLPIHDAIQQPYKVGLYSKKKSEKGHFPRVYQSTTKKTTITLLLYREKMTFISITLLLLLLIM